MAEAEYVVLYNTMCKVVWLCGLVAELTGTLAHMVQLYCDNISAISIATFEKFSNHSKHFDIECHYTWQLIEEKQITIDYIPSADQLADPLTKALSRFRVKHFTDTLSLHT